MRTQKPKQLVVKLVNEIFNSIPRSGEAIVKDLEYNSLEDYKSITGKKFRRTNAEIKEGLSPEEAFNKRYDNV